MNEGLLNDGSYRNSMTSIKQLKSNPQQTMDSSSLHQLTSPLARTQSITELSKTPKMNFSKGKAQGAFLFGYNSKRGGHNWTTSSLNNAETEANFRTSSILSQKADLKQMKSMGAAGENCD